MHSADFVKKSDACLFMPVADELAMRCNKALKELDDWKVTMPISPDFRRLALDHRCVWSTVNAPYALSAP